jgi:membrane protein required for colicin V production
VNTVDLILLLLLALFALRGYFKGLFREIFSVLGLVLGLMVAARYDDRVAALWAETWKHSFLVLRAATFAALFFCTYFSLNLIGWLLHRSAPHLFLQGVNRIGGVVVGVGKGAALMALAIFFLAQTPLVPRRAQENIGRSYLAGVFERLAAELVALGRTRFPGPVEPSAGGRIPPGPPKNRPGKIVRFTA